MSAALQQFEVLEGLCSPNSHKIGLENLAELIGRPVSDLSQALKLENQGLSEVDPSNKVVQKWLTIFNLVVLLISQTEPNLSKDKAFLKIKRWINLPNGHFNNKPPLEMMLKGQTKKVINLLEQLAI